MNDFDPTPPPVPTANVCDAHDDALVVARVFHDYGSKTGACGPAHVLVTNNDNSVVKELLTSPGHGRILVIDNQGKLDRAMVGGNLAKWGAENGWAGIIVNGCIRDSHEIAREPITVKAIGTCPRKSDKGTAHTYEQASRIGGVTINPGDWITMDHDGVVMTPHRPGETS